MEKTQQILFLTLVVSVLHFSEAKPHCNPSACGNIRRIKYPFRLKGDPNHCGDPRFELACENNVTSISLNSHKYYVKAINYGSSRIRLVDASVNNDDIFSFPNSSAYHYNFTFLQASSVFNTYSTSLYDDPYYDVSPINFMSCPHPLTNSSLFSVSTTHSNSSHHRYTYVKVGSMIASEFPETCELEVTVMTSWKFKDLNNVSLSEIHQSLLYGFELTFCTNNCQPWPSPTNWVLLPILLGIVGLICALVSNPVLSVVGLGAVSFFLFNTGFLLYAAIRPLHNVVTSARLILLVIDVVTSLPMLPSRRTDK